MTDKEILDFAQYILQGSGTDMDNINIAESIHIISAMIYSIEVSTW